jgi:hypothetical protein
MERVFNINDIRRRKIQNENLDVLDCNSSPVLQLYHFYQQLLLVCL